MKEKVVMIEFSKTGRPFAVVRKDEKGYSEYFDIEWCERDQQLYADEAGNGFYLGRKDNKFWLSAGMPLPLVKGIAPANPDNRLIRRPRGYGGDLWDWAIQCECEHCSICGDSFPDNDLCEHIYWDDEAGWWSTPDSRKESER
jgi:hypothetical protein